MASSAKVLAGVQFLDHCLRLVLCLDEDMPGLHLFLRRNGCNFLVIARLHFFRRHGIDHMLFEIGVVQFPFRQEGNALLERLVVLKAFLFGVLQKQLDVDNGRKRCGALLLVGHPLKLRIEARDCEIKFRLADFLVPDFRNDRVGPFGAGDARCNHRDQGRGRKGLVSEHFPNLSPLAASAIGAGPASAAQQPECGGSAAVRPCKCVDIIRPPSYLSRNLASRTVSGRFAA